MKIKEKQAVSFIVLVITVIVLSILAATVIVSISDTDVISETNKTAFKADMVSYKEAYEMYVTSETMKDLSFDRNSLNLKYGDEEFENIFGKLSEKYQEGLAVEDGRLVYETADSSKKEILADLDMCPTEPISKDVSYVGCYADTDGDGTVDGAIYVDFAFSGGTSLNVIEYSGTNYSSDYTTYVKDYSYNAKDHSELKDYVISGEYEAKSIIKVKGNGSGTDRFYVMALEDWDYQLNGSNAYPAAAYGNLVTPTGWFMTGGGDWECYFANKKALPELLTESLTGTYLRSSWSVAAPAGSTKDGVSYDLIQFPTGQYNYGYGGYVRLSTIF